MDRLRLIRYAVLLLGLALVLLAPGEGAHAAPLQASTVSLTMNNPSCGKSLTESGSCSIQINNLIVSGSDPSFSRLEVLVNGKLRVSMGGFFEATAYLSSSMLPNGIQVACGGPNAGGNPNYGKSYLVSANAYMADGTSASDSMTVYCPYYDGKVYLPGVVR
jgi:hypothetical protein